MKLNIKIQTRITTILVVLFSLFLLSGCTKIIPVVHTPKVEATWKIKTKAWDQQITVSWKKQKESKGYNLYWSTNSKVDLLKSNKISRIKSPFQHKNLKNGVTYYYRVTSIQTEKKGNPLKNVLVESKISTITSAKAVQLYKIFPKFIAIVAQPGDSAKSLAKRFLKDSNKFWTILEYNRIRYVRPNQKLIIPLKTTEPGGLALRRYQTVPILTYHQFKIGKIHNQMFVNKISFEQQMRYLKENKYNVITLDQLYDFLNFNADIPEKSVVITFDDGFRSVYDIAFPILKKYSFPSTFFVYSDLIEKEKVSLSWDQLREMNQNGMDIQCHTKSHRDLRYKSRNNRHLKEFRRENFVSYFQSIIEEFTVSGRKIFEELNKECTYLAYPYGGTNQLVIAMARKFGYKAAFTVKRGGNAFFAHNYRIRRDMVFGRHNLRNFIKILNKRYGKRALR
ncbi:MAG: peptidoglycan/xylan/chitin deacetylase (PgdA/CDA1 family) [bacterium]|jgi:peptidoglycan/xylan/chitin deacetylase (PgdA/CDA1 family)